MSQLLMKKHTHTDVLSKFLKSNKIGWVFGLSQIILVLRGHWSFEGWLRVECTWKSINHLGQEAHSRNEAKLLGYQSVKNNQLFLTLLWDQTTTLDPYLSSKCLVTINYAVLKKSPWDSWCSTQEEKKVRYLCPIPLGAWFLEDSLFRARI